MTANILIVDDEKLIRWSLQKELEKRGYQAFSAATLAEGRRLFDAEKPELVMLDIQLPDGDGTMFLKEIRRREPLTSVIMITANDQVQTAVSCMQEGAYTYLHKPFDFEEAFLNIEKALETQTMRRRIKAYDSRQKEKYDFSRMIGDSPAMKQVLALIRQVAASPFSTVLLQGESGTGKDMSARALHFGGDNASRPFLSINCAAIPLTLLESELFGHEKGAFTDARESKKGLVEEAAGGTLFLDEIGDMPKEMQAKLLHLIDQKKYRKLGGLQEREVDVRIIAATNRDLRREVEEGRFREDLFYRLNVIPIKLPPLRERREDIPLLVSYFISHYNREFRKQVEGIETEALSVLMQYDWPGNVRELKNTIERCMILNEGSQILRDNIPTEIDCHCVLREECRPGSRRPGQVAALPRCISGMPLDSVEKQAIILTLEQSGGNQSKAARMLGIGRDALRYKMVKYDLVSSEKEPEGAISPRSDS